MVKALYRSMHTHECRGAFARTHDKMRARMFTCLHLMCACLYTNLYETFFGRSLLSYELKCKFHKDPIFCCGDICKTIWMFVSSLIAKFDYYHPHPPGKV